MPLTRPTYISAVNPRIDWPWDDWNVEASYRPGDTGLTERLAPLMRRAQIAMTVAIGEWIAFALESADPDPTPRQYLEAAWAGTIHHAYCPNFEFQDRDWMGPVRGPLHLMMALINDALHFEGAEPSENAGWMSQLAELLVPSIEQFEDWKEAVLQRLELNYQAVPEAKDDFAYDWEVSEFYVPRECFDPGTPFDPSATDRLIRRFLRAIDYVGNPFVSTPADLQDAGVIAPIP